MRDSKAPDAPPYRCRVVVLQRRTKDTFSYFATNAPAAEYTDAFMLDSYFARWPLQEGVFRQLNGTAAFKTVHGYGKQRVLNVSVVDEMTRLSAQVERLNCRIEKSQEEVRKKGTLLHKAEVEQRRLERTEDNAKHAQRLLAKAAKSHTKPAETQRHRQEGAHTELKNHKPKVKNARRQHLASIKKQTNLKKLLTQETAEQATLASRRQIYQNDTELDHTMTVLKLGWMMLLRFVILNFFGGMKRDINTLLNQILQLPGTRITTRTTETIRFQAHRRNPEMMELLGVACEKFNAMKVVSDDHVMRFEVDRPPRQKDHADVPRAAP